MTTRLCPDQGFAAAPKNVDTGTAVVTKANASKLE
jgi:hypothetical protein